MFYKMNAVFILYSFIIFVIELSKKKSRVLGDIKHSDSCKELLDEFANASAGFTLCTVKNARPVNICCSCVNEYFSVLEKHDNIIQLNVNSSCQEKLVNQDRLEVIENGFLYITNLWSRGQCENCFKSNNTLSNSTREFIKLYSDTNKCIEDQYNPSNHTYNPDVCVICSEIYYNMSRFYTKLKENSGNGNVCMDIVDSVNVTQNLWSNVLHCGETVMTFDLPLIAISTTFFIIPVIFYLCAWRFTKDRSSAVLNQNRVSQRMLENDRRRWGIPSSGSRILT